MKRQLPKDMVLIRQHNQSILSRYKDLVSPIIISCEDKFFEWDGDLTVASFTFIEDFFEIDVFAEGDEFMIGPFRTIVLEMDHPYEQALLGRV